MENIDKQEIHTIFEKIKKGKKNAIEELYLKYKKLILNISFCIAKDKNVAEEITQIVFLKIMQISGDRLPQSNEINWLYTVTKNQTLDYLKKKHNYIDLDDIYEISEDETDIDKIVEKDYFNRLIECLEAEEKEIVSLKILGDLTFKQISLILNKPIATIQWKYYKAVHTLKILISNLSMFIITILLYVNSNKEKYQENSQNYANNDTQTHNQTLKPSSIDKFGDNVESSAVQSTSNSNNIHYGFLGISSIFLIITIIFTIIFIKHQQKRHHKKSK